jgi:hypothetical protein
MFTRVNIEFPVGERAVNLQLELAVELDARARRSSTSAECERRSQGEAMRRILAELRRGVSERSYQVLYLPGSGLPRILAMPDSRPPD